MEDYTHALYRLYEVSTSVYLLGKGKSIAAVVSAVANITGNFWKLVQFVQFVFVKTHYCHIII